MLKVLSTLLAIRTSSAINLFFYYAQKLPVVGKRINNAVYARTDLKRSASFLVWAALLLWSVVSKLLYLYLLVYLPVMAAGGTGNATNAHEPLALFAHIFALISLLVAGISSANVLEPKREKVVAVKLMRMSPIHYMQAFLLYRYAVFFASYIPALLLFVLLLEGTAAQAVMLAVSVAGWRVLCEYAHLKLFEHKGTVLIKKTGLVWLVIIAGYAAAYVPLVLETTPTVGPVLLHGITVVVIAVLGAWAVWRLAGYRHYREAVDAATKRDDPYLNIRGMIADASKESVQARESDYSEETVRQASFAGKEGYAYLNAIFFARHRSLVRRPLQKRLIFIAATGVFGSLALFVLGRVQPGLLQLELPMLFSFLPLAMSLLTVGETTCKAMFYHCDISLTRYHFYRGAAYEHFWIRLRRMLGPNLLIAAASAGALMLATFTASGNLPLLDTVLLFLYIAGLAAFFTIHPLFLYYIFQPYSTDLNVKNPFYFLVSMLVSAACGFAIFVSASPLLLTGIVLSVTLVYLAVADLSVRKYGHDTFRVK